MKLSIPRCIVTKCYHSDKAGKDYLTIETGESTLQISGGELDLSKVPLLVPLKIEAEITSRMFGRALALYAVSFSATPI